MEDGLAPDQHNNLIKNTIEEINLNNDIKLLEPTSATNGDGDTINTLLASFNTIHLTKGTYTIKAGYPIRITSNNKKIKGENGTIIKLADNAYEPCIYVGTKSASAISNITIENLKIDGNRSGNIARGATCTLVYTDLFRATGSQFVWLYDKNGTKKQFIEGTSSDTGNLYYWSGWEGGTQNETFANTRATNLTNAINRTGTGFTAVLDTSTNTITVTQIKNNDNTEDAHTSSTNSTDISFITTTNFATHTIRETSGSLTSPVIKNNCIIAHNVNDLTINSCILDSCLSGGIVCGDACIRVNINDCKSRGHVFDGMAFDGPHEDFSINNCVLYENDYAGFSFDTGVVGAFNVTNCHCINNKTEGFYIRDVNDIMISNCTVKLNGKHGFAIQKVDDSNFPKNIQISNCLIQESGNDGTTQGTAYDGIQLSKAHDVIISGCNILHSSKRGIAIEAKCERVSIINCNLITNGVEAEAAENNSGDGIFLADSSNINISNSLFKSNASCAIQIENFSDPSSGVAITKDININGCSFYNHTDDKAIRINGFSNGGIENITINSCTFRNNTQAIHCRVHLEQAGNFDTNKKYTIKSVGTTTWTSIGAADNNLGTVFKATGPGSGNGWAAGVNNLVISNNTIIKEGGQTDIGAFLNPSTGTPTPPTLLFDVNNTKIINS